MRTEFNGKGIVVTYPLDKIRFIREMNMFNFNYKCMEKKSISPHVGGRKTSNRVKHAMYVHLVLFLSLFCMTSAVFGQQKKLSFEWKDVPLSDVFNALEKADVYKFVFNYEDTKPYKVTLDVKGKNVLEILDAVLKEKPFSYKTEGIYIMIRYKEPDTKRFIVEGKVIDGKSNPLPGVTVLQEGTTIGTATDSDGKFKILLTKEKGILLFSFIGYKSRQVTYEAGKNIIVKMEEEVTDLDEVVIRAYGTQNKKEVVSSITSIKADEMKELPSHSILSMLQGRLAGVDIVNQSGAPGAGGNRVAVRGYNSLLEEGATDGQPLYVVDGVPMFSFNSPATGTNTLSDLDPSMIASVEMLKDAAAAAIYGSRAGNGVILITTKKGQAGKAKFSVNFSYTVSFLPVTPEQTGGRLERMVKINNFRHSLDAIYDDYTQLGKYPTSYEDAYRQGSGGYDAWWGNGYVGSAKDHPILQDSLNPFYNNQTNWYKYSFQTGKVLNANIQTSGGSDKVQYMIGAGYYNEKGIMLNSNYSRANLMVNLSAKPIPVMSAAAHVYMAYMDKSRNLNNAGTTSRNIEGMTVDPASQTTLFPGHGKVNDEFLARINQTVSRNDNYRLISSLNLEFQLYDGLTLSGLGAVDYTQSNVNEFTPSTLDGALHRNVSLGEVSRKISLMNEELLNYRIEIAQKHTIEALLGFNISKEQGFSINGIGYEGPNDNVYWYSGPGGVANYQPEGYEPRWESRTDYSSNFEEQTMLSYFGRLSYNFKKLYIVEFAYRRDGSSTFGTNVRWADFPSIALGWNFADEAFMKNISWLNSGKLRLSWGKSGQVFQEAYMAYGMMSKNGLFQGKPGMTTMQAVAPDLTWEKTKQYNAGLDLELFEYRLNVKLDYYDKITYSMISNVPAFGDVNVLSYFKRNSGEISNQGVELELKADIFRQSEVRWRSRLNISRNWNKLIGTYDGKDMTNHVLKRGLFGIYVFEDDGYYQNEKEVPVYYNNAGYPIYLNRIQGEISGMVGEKKIRDVNGDGVIDDDDLFYIGSALPQAYGGWANEISWKNFDLNILFNYSLGRRMINVIRHVTPFNTEGPIFRDLTKVTFWEKEGDMTDLPRLGASSIYPDLRSNVERVNMLRLKQLTLGYNLPEKWAKKIYFSGARLFITGENIWTWSNYSGADPEVVDMDSGMDNGKAYPLPEKWTFGLTLNF